MPGKRGPRQPFPRIHVARYGFEGSSPKTKSYPSTESNPLHYTLHPISEKRLRSPFHSFPSSANR